jgi:hypothetical protein
MVCEVRGSRLEREAPLDLRIGISYDIAPVGKIGTRESVAALRTRDGGYATAA